MVSSAEDFVGNDVASASIADDHLFPFSNHRSIYGSGIMRCAFATPTERFDLKGLYPISKLD
jgi:hypothetical protein